MSYASVYEQTDPRQCCNLLIAWLWTQPVIVLPSVARACDDQSTVHLDWQLGGSSYGINRVLLRISIWFSCQFAGFHVANRAVIDVCYSCANVWSVLAHFGSEYSRTGLSTGRSGGHRLCVYVAVFVTRVACPISCSHSTVAVAAPARLRLLARCAVVSYDPLSHSRHNAWDRSTKVGYAINVGIKSNVDTASLRKSCHDEL